jgi:hypothetical protein
MFVDESHVTIGQLNGGMYNGDRSRKHHPGGVTAFACLRPWTTAP